MRRPAKIALVVGGGLLGLVLLVIIAALLIARSDWFHEKVRSRIIVETERATGGKVDLKAFRFDWRTLTAEVNGFVLRGLEPESDPPLFRANSLSVGLKIVSAFRRDIDVAFITVDQPRVRIIVDKNGRSNVPGPKTQRKDGLHWSERLIRLAVQKLELRDGNLEYLSKNIPLDIRAEHFVAELDYDAAGPRYKGMVRSRRVEVDHPEIRELPFDMVAVIALEKERIAIPEVTLRMRQTVIRARGAIEDLRRPRMEFAFNGNLSLAELGPPLRLPVAHEGSAAVNGTLSIGGGTPFALRAKLDGTGLAWRRAGPRIENIRLETDVVMSPGKIQLSDLRVRALGGQFTGAATITDFKRFDVEGQVSEVSAGALSKVGGAPAVRWDGTFSGPVKLSGFFGREGVTGTQLSAEIKVEPAPGESPIQGFVDIRYDQRTGALRFGQSSFSTTATRLNLTGGLGDTLHISLLSRNLDDVLPVLAMFSDNPPRELPARLENGVVTFEGTVTGSTNDPRITGHASATNIVWRRLLFDRVTADIAMNRSALDLTRVEVQRGQALAKGQLRLGLANWRPADSSPIEASADVQGVDLARTIRDAGQNLPVEGVLSAAARISGTVGAVQGGTTFTVEKPKLYGESFDRIRGELRYQGGSVELVSGNVEVGTAKFAVTGAYDHPENDWKNGRLRFDVSGGGLNLSQIRRAQEFRTGVTGQIDLKAAGAADVVNGSFRLASIDGRLHLTKLTAGQREIGNVVIDTKTAGDVLSVNAKADAVGSRITASGEWRMSGDYPGSGRIEFTPLQFSTLAEFRSPGSGTRDLPFAGFISGTATFSGPLADLNRWRGQVQLASLEIRPNQPRRTQRDDMVLRNQGPVLLDVDTKGVNVKSASLTGSGTQLQVAGLFSFSDKNPWDLKVKGTLNLAAMRSFEEDLLSAGTAVIDASVRGAVADPQVFGRVALNDASFYLENVPNGIDKLNGVVLFDRNRATIAEKLTGQTGGGDIAFTGFASFGGGELIYRLNVDASGVRVRYPEGVSTTLNASLNLSGTSSRSLLAGTATVLRLGFNPRTDLGGLLAEAARPTPAAAPTQNEFLRNMQFDVHVVTAPNVEFQSTLTRELQAEADLRFRGSPIRPILLGRVIINQGEISFFGNRYTINRGEIGFFNPVKIEPILDMDLETRVRGITVTINFSGPVDKLNVTYRSDPPLASTEIVALLTVGRSPDATRSLASGQISRTGSFLDTGANTLLGQAIAAPVSSRLQRFFGVSRLKIDPQLAGLEGRPQAHLTLEQQVSRDITLTFATNLTNSQQQIVRVEWNLSREWSLIAVRDENGIFGVDFQYKKRFK